MVNLRFRAWDKEKNEYYYFDIYSGFKGIKNTIVEESVLWGPIEQCTGLNDLDNKEIYYISFYTGRINISPGYSRQGFS